MKEGTDLAAGSAAGEASGGWPRFARIAASNFDLPRPAAAGASEGRSDMGDGGGGGGGGEGASGGLVAVGARASGVGGGGRDEEGVLRREGQVKFEN